MATKQVHPDVRLDALEKRVDAMASLLSKQATQLTEARQRIAMLQTQIQTLTRRT